MRLARDVGLPLHQDSRVHALHLQVVGAGDALLDAGVAAHEVEDEAFAEHIAEIKCEAAWQRLQAEHTQQLGDAGIGLEKLALREVDVELSVER